MKRQPNYWDLPAHARREIDKEFRREVRRTQRRNQQRIQATLEGRWEVCCIPGCRTRARNTSEYDRDSRKRLPICHDHGVLIHAQMVPVWENPDVQAARERYVRDYLTREADRVAQTELQYQNDGHAEGQLYFVRIGGMVKLGWSSKLRDRLKQYGASAEVLCHWPGTRQDETTMHRQLRPQLARGREWYHDNDVLAGVVADCVRRHGEPTILPYWTEPRPDMVAKKRYAA